MSKKQTEAERIANCPFGIHEALHATHIIRCIVEEQLENHPAIKLRPKLKEFANQAGDALAELYQGIAEIEDEESA